MSVNKVRKLMGVKKQAACGTVAKVRDRLCHPRPTVVPQDVVADFVARTKASLAQAGALKERDVEYGCKANARRSSRRAVGREPRPKWRRKAMTRTRTMTMTGAVVMTATTTMRCRYDDDDVDDDVDGNTLTVADCDED